MQEIDDTLLKPRFQPFLKLDISDIQQIITDYIVYPRHYSSYWGYNSE